MNFLVVWVVLGMELVRLLFILVKNLLKVLVIDFWLIIL